MNRRYPLQETEVDEKALRLVEGQLFRKGGGLRVQNGEEEIPIAVRKLFPRLSGLALVLGLIGRSESGVTFRRPLHLGQLLSDLGLILPSGKYDSFAHRTSSIRLKSIKLKSIKPKSIKLKYVTKIRRVGTFQLVKRYRPPSPLPAILFRVRQSFAALPRAKSRSMTMSCHT